jgi:hypothetical protein
MTTTQDAPASARCDPQEHATAARIQRGNSRWLILWGTHSRRYFAFPRFSTPPGTIITAPAAPELLDHMRQAELTAAGGAQHRP